MLIPCYADDEKDPVGFLKHSGPVRGDMITFTVADADIDVGFASASMSIPSTSVQIDRIDVKLSKRSISFDAMDLRLYAIEDVLDRLMRRGVPIGVTPMTIDRDPASGTFRLIWSAVRMTTEQHEELFDHNFFLVCDDQSDLIDHDLVSHFIGSVDPGSARLNMLSTRINAGQTINASKIQAGAITAAKVQAGAMRWQTGVKILQPARIEIKILPPEPSMPERIWGKLKKFVW